MPMTTLTITGATHLLSSGDPVTHLQLGSGHADLADLESLTAVPGAFKTLPAAAATVGNVTNVFGEDTDDAAAYTNFSTLGLWVGDPADASSILLSVGSAAAGQTYGDKVLNIDLLISAGVALSASQQANITFAAGIFLNADTTRFGVVRIADATEELDETVTDRVPNIRGVRRHLASWWNPLTFSADKITSGVLGEGRIPQLPLSRVIGAAPLASPLFTGNPEVPNQAAGSNNGRAANTRFVAAGLAALVDSSPTTLNTLNELAAALGDDPNFATSIMTALGLKANRSELPDTPARLSSGFPVTLGVPLDRALAESLNDHQWVSFTMGPRKGVVERTIIVPVGDLPTAASTEEIYLTVRDLASHDLQLYIVETSDGSLAAIGDPQTIPLVTPFPVGMGALGTIMYALPKETANRLRLRQVDLLTGIMSDLGELVTATLPGPGVGAEGLNGTLYVLINSGTAVSLYSVEIAGVTTTQIGGMQLVNQARDGVGMAAVGQTMYAMTIDGNFVYLWTVNLANGVLTAVGNVDVGNPDSVGLATRSGVLYAMVGRNHLGNAGLQFYSVDTSDASLTAIGPFRSTFGRFGVGMGSVTPPGLVLSPDLAVRRTGNTTLNISPLKNGYVQDIIGIP